MKHIHTFESFLNEAVSIDPNAKKIIDALPSGGNMIAKKEISQIASALKKAKVIKTQNGFKVESPDGLSSFFYATLASRLNDYSNVVKHVKDNEFEIVSDEIELS